MQVTTFAKNRLGQKEIIRMETISEPKPTIYDHLIKALLSDSKIKRDALTIVLGLIAIVILGACLGGNW